MECDNCYRRNALYRWGYARLCYQCAVNKYERMTHYCMICHNVFENVYAVFSKTMLCENCKYKYGSEYSRVHSNRTRAKKLGLAADLTLLEWLDILNSFGWKCAYCNNEFCQMDHMTPISKGGGTTMDNVIPVCKECNYKKGIKDFTSYIFDELKIHEIDYAGHTEQG